MHTRPTPASAPAPEAEAAEHFYKIILLGDSGVGKTNIVLRYTADSFDVGSRPTIGVELSTKHLVVDGSKVKLNIWDTAGQERFRAVTNTYYRNSNGILIVYDTSKRSSFENLDFWLKEVEQHTENVVLLLVGNKCDLRYSREVSIEEGMAFAKSREMFFIESSSKEAGDRALVESVFDTIIGEIHKRNAAKRPEGSSKAFGQVPDSDKRVDIAHPNSSDAAGKSGRCC